MKKRGAPVRVKDGRPTSFYLSVDDRKSIEYLRKKLGKNNNNETIREVIQMAKSQYC